MRGFFLAAKSDIYQRAALETRGSIPRASRRLYTIEGYHGECPGLQKDITKTDVYFLINAIWKKTCLKDLQFPLATSIIIIGEVSQFQDKQYFAEVKKIVFQSKDEGVNLCMATKL